MNRLPTSRTCSLSSTKRDDDRFRQLGDATVEFAPEPFFGVVDYFSCYSASSEYIVSAAGRYAHPDSRPSAPANAAAMRDLFADQGLDTSTR